MITQAALQTQSLLVLGLSFFLALAAGALLHRSHFCAMGALSDVFVMGDDWAGKFDFMAEHCSVVYLARTPDVSSTEIKQRMHLQRTAAMHF